MAYDQDLTTRIRQEIEHLPGFSEKKMFGGVGFLINGNMACGVHRDNMIVRVGPAHSSQALAQPHTKPFDMTGRPMASWVEVEPPGFATQAAFTGWIRQGVEYAQSLPPK